MEPGLHRLQLEAAPYLAARLSSTDGLSVCLSPQVERLLASQSHFWPIFVEQFGFETFIWGTFFVKSRPFWQL
jgi:hypothetical protein